MREKEFNTTNKEVQAITDYSEPKYLKSTRRFFEMVKFYRITIPSAARFQDQLKDFQRGSAKKN